ncbi:MAG: SidA/IucD/PvdA family monooxygenase [Gammaproteobacteria bacterium]|nr:SidA/IucD/PvdA family monooxygenase [Gammaproteobacteria bacterium]
MQVEQIHRVDIAGIGIGPFNMSLAALLQPVSKLSSIFLDQKPTFSWHPGMMLDNAKLQVSFMKDLVTLVDPSNPFSFTNFLAKQKRLYRFLTANFSQIYRAEFSQYLLWVSQQLPNLEFSQQVEDIDYKYKHFVIKTAKKIIYSKHLIIGTGVTPYIPKFAEPYVGDTVFHNSAYLTKRTDWREKHVSIIGGGQSGAEILQDLLADKHNLPKEISWISPRSSFFPMDDSPFANELFMPAYNEFFYTLSKQQKEKLLAKQVLSSDGITESLLVEIYQRIYYLQCIEKVSIVINLLPSYKLAKMTKHLNRFKCIINSEYQDIEKTTDYMIFCTGYHQKIPAFMSTLQSHLCLQEGKYHINKDFSVEWKGHPYNKIYVQNAARHSHGVADPNLSLMAWRSATIINSLLKEVVYDIDDMSHSINWMELYPSNHLEDIDEKVA